MLKIGEFARISQVPVKTLRHYDALGVLKPVWIDTESGYRFYELGQLSDVVRILALKDCGLSLEEIARLLKTHDASAIEEVLRQQVAAQRYAVVEAQARLQRMVARMEQLGASDGIAHYDIALKQSDALTLLGQRTYIRSHEEIGAFARFVAQQLDRRSLLKQSPLIHLYVDAAEHDEWLDMFVGIEVSDTTLPEDGWAVERLEGRVPVACAIYRGDYPGISVAYGAISRWLAASGYQARGPCREIYHRSPLHTNDPAEYLTEIQYPFSDKVTR
jgi:DNA-binding transcriptional MerR regulator